MITAKDIKFRTVPAAEYAVRFKRKSRVKRLPPMARKSWDEAHEYLVKSVPARKLSDLTCNFLLTVTSDFINGAAHWRKIYGIWSCIGADQSLKWMIGQSPAKVHLELLRLGVTYRWEGLSVRLCGSIHGCRCTAPASSTNDAAVRPASSHSGLEAHILISGESPG